MTPNSYKILIVDDERDILEFIGYNLKQEGYQVYTAGNSSDAVRTALKVGPHLIILDVMLPDTDGIETCAELRKHELLKDTVIVFLTARAEDYSQIAGLEAGGDDYITKPIRPRILLSRVKAWLRRAGTSAVKAGQETTKNLIIDKERYLVIIEGKEITLARKEFELLLLLASRPNKVFTREEIYTGVWGEDVFVGDRTIDVHIRKIREKTGISSIKTIKGVGYKYEES